MATCPKCAGQYFDGAGHLCPVPPESIAVAEDPELAPGAMVGEYEVEHLLGEGGFGTVFQVVHPLIGKAAALKVLSHDFSANPEMVSRFVSEARAVNQIRNKGIVDIFAFGVLPSGRHYLVMELLEGMPFDRYLAQVGSLPPETGLPLLRSIARALDAAHAAGIVHRDLKPENVFLVFDEEGLAHTKLLDFGIAKYVGELSSGDGHRTRTGTPIGSPLFMSPEQCRGSAVDQRTDVYSLGVMCFQVLTGKPPFDAPAVIDLLFQHANAQPPSPSALAPKLPQSFDGPILRMLAKSPDDRPASAGEAIDALFAAAQQVGLEIPLGPVAVPRPEPPPSEPGSDLPDELAATSPSALGTPRGATPVKVRKVVSRPVGTPGSAYPVTTPGRPRNTPRARSTPAAPVRGPFRWIALGVVGSLLAVGLIAVLARPQATPKQVEKPVLPDPVVVAPKPNPPLVPVTDPLLAPKPKSVTVTVRCAVKNAAVYLGATQLGAAGEALEIPYSTQAVALTVKAAGYKPTEVEVVPSEDQAVTVDPKPVAPKLNKDLESPFN